MCVFFRTVMYSYRMWQNELLRSLLWVGRWVGSISLNGCIHAVLVYPMAWLGEHHAFVVKKFIENGRLPIATQCAFCICFVLGNGILFLIKKMIPTWLLNFGQTSSSVSPGWPWTTTGPENVATIRVSIEQSPLHFIWKHLVVLWLSDHIVRRILWPRSGNSSLQKVVGQELRDFGTCIMLCPDIIQNVHTTDVFGWGTFPPFRSNKQTKFQLLVWQ